MLSSMALRVLMLAALLIPGCESEPTATATAPPSPSPTSIPTATPSPMASPSPTAERACTDASVTGEVQVRIAARDFFFDPECLIILGGQGLVVRNTGANTHNFTIEGSTVGFDLDPGVVNRTEAVGGAVPPGTYRFYCVYHQGQGMDGELTVSAAG
jgi:plastocyanin